MQAALQSIEAWLAETPSRTTYSAEEVRDRLLDLWLQLAPEPGTSSSTPEEVTAVG